MTLCCILMQAAGQRPVHKVLPIPASALSSNQGSRGHARPPTPHAVSAARGGYRAVTRTAPAQLPPAAAPSAVTSNVRPPTSDTVKLCYMSVHAPLSTWNSCTDCLRKHVANAVLTIDSELVTEVRTVMIVNALWAEIGALCCPGTYGTNWQCLECAGTSST